jgi:mRNA interferase MazF
MRRGDLVLVALKGDFGKPRPALVVQADEFNDTHASVIVCPLTTTLLDLPIFRVRIMPSAKNGLRIVSEIMVDKLQAVLRERLNGPIGRLEEDVLAIVDASLVVFLGLESLAPD